MKGNNSMTIMLNYTKDTSAFSHFVPSELGHQRNLIGLEKASISHRFLFSLMDTKAPFTLDRINLGPVPDWVQIGLVFTRDLLEPLRCGST